MQIINAEPTQMSQCLINLVSDIFSIAVISSISSLNKLVQSILVIWNINTPQ